MKRSSWLDAVGVGARSGRVAPGVFVDVDVVDGRVLVEVGESGNVVSVPGSGLFVRGGAVSVQLAEDGSPLGVIEGSGGGGSEGVPIGSTAEGVVAAKRVARSAEDIAAEAALEADRIRGEFDPFVVGTNKELGRLQGETAQAAEGAAQAILDAMAARDASMVGSTDWYASSPGPTVPPVSGWSMVPPVWMSGAYVWRKTVVTHGDGSQVVGEPVLTTGHAGESAALVRIDSSRGTVFKDDSFSTVLRATVFDGATQIVNLAGLWEAFGPSAYLEWWWRRYSDDEFGLISSSDSRLGDSGFSLTVGLDDVDVSTVFQCVLNI